MANKFINQTRKQIPFAKGKASVAPLTTEEKADLKMRILLAINAKMA